MADTDLDALADKFTTRMAKLMRRKPADDFDDDDEPGGNDGRDGRRVPYGRFADKVREAKELRAALAELKEDFASFQETASAQFTQVKDTHAKAIQKMQEDAAKQVAAAAAQHAEDVSLSDIGIRDPLGRRAARDAYNAMPEADRPKTPGEWIRSIQEAGKARQQYLADPKADKDKAPALPDVPATIRAYLEEHLRDPQVEVKPGAKAPQVDAHTRAGPPPSALEMQPSKDTGWDEFINALENGG